MDDEILKLIKTLNQISYEELKKISNLSDKTLNIIIKRLLNDKIIIETNNKYVFSLENYILKIINHYNPTKDEIDKYIKGFEKDELIKVIDKLLNDKKIFYNYNSRLEVVKNDYYIANIERNSKNQSFVTIDGEKILIPDEDLHTALKYDTVIVTRTFENKGTVLGIIKRKNNKLVCEVKENNNKLILVPFNGNVEISIKVNNNNLLKDLIIGDRVYIELDCKCNPFNIVFADNITKIGHFNDKNNDAIAIAISKDFDIDFSSDAMKEANSIPTEVTIEDRENRIDLTNETIFTIDSIHTKDMDDAVSIKELYNGNYLLGVHIADVAHYVKPFTTLFESAKKRGTSVYLDDVVIPMLPSILSNGICSLNEGVERLTKSVIMEITPKGTIENYKILDTVIKSKKKMTYEELNEFFNGNEIDISYLPFINDINIMRKLSSILTNKKNNQGNLEFESSDIKINKNVLKNDEIIGFEARKQEEAQKIIENFMILANEIIASHFYWQDLPFIYRVHNNPDDIKIDSTIDIIKNLGYKLVRVQNCYGQKALQNILNDFKDTKEYSIISNLLLRSMAKAKYSTDNIGHYALALDNYCHFTSPIRRFPDLMIHTLINFFNSSYYVDYNYAKIQEDLSDIAEHSSYKERQADDAEKDYIKLKMAKYMEEHIGEEFTGIILDIDKNKVFIKLDNNIKGILDMNSDFNLSFNIDSHNKVLNCKYSKQEVKLGTKVIVKVSRVDIPQKEIFFDIKEIVKENDIKKLELKK